MLDIRLAVRIHDDDVEVKECYSWEEVHKFFFSPWYDNKFVIAFQVSGKTYAEKKANLENLAIDYSNFRSYTSLSWLKYAEISNFFETNGRRYGLLTDFRENAIC